MDVEGIVLKVIPYKEKDGLVSILSSDGVITFLARGIYKIDSKNSLLTNLYTRAIFELTESKNGYYSLKSGNVIQLSSSFLNDLDKVLVLDAIAELIIKTSDSNNISMLYPFIDNCYHLIMKNDIDPLVSVAIIGVKYLMYNGYNMHVDGCVVCNQKNKLVSFDFSSGGFLCHKHFDAKINTNQSPTYMHAIRQLFLVPSDKLNLLKLNITDIVLILIDLKEFINSNCGFYWSGIETIIKCRRS